MKTVELKRKDGTIATITTHVGYVEDERGNRFSFGQGVEKQSAIDSLLSLSNCSNCINCRDCIDCDGCLGCIYCGGCRGCRDCRGCIYCLGCSNCIYCSNSSGCSNSCDCVDCRDCINSSNSSGPPVEIPIIENIHQVVYNAAKQEGALNMGKWHSCSTTHCRAGWVVFLAGEKGYELEKFYNSTAMAAMLIYRESGYAIPMSRFFETDEEALADMKRLAEGENEKFTD